MIRLCAAKMLGVDTSKSSQYAHQADGLSPLRVVGETHFTVVRDNREFLFEVLVVEDLDVDILAGIPFMEQNDVTVRPAKHEIILGDCTTYLYGSRNSASHHTVRLAVVLQAAGTSSTIWPGDYIEVELPHDLSTIDEDFAVEPRSNTFVLPNGSMWPLPDMFTSVAGKIRISNLTNQPQTLKRHEHFCQVHAVSIPTEADVCTTQSTSCVKSANMLAFHSDSIHLDPDHVFPHDMLTKFKTLSHQYDDVFNQAITGYNGASGPFRAVVNMGPVQPPRRKGRISQYSRDKLVDLQHK